MTKHVDFGRSFRGAAWALAGVCCVGLLSLGTTNCLPAPADDTGGSGGSSSGGSGGNSSASGGDNNTGGNQNTGGNNNAGGNNNSGGTSAKGGSQNSGGTNNPGGTISKGGSPNTGGVPNSGGTTVSPSGGTSVVSSGGVSSPGGATTSTGGSTVTLTSCTPSGALTISGSYVTDGNCGGYAFTFASVSAKAAAGSVTISPTCTTSGCTPAFAGAGLCVTGSVGIASDSGSVAGVGFNLLQPQTGGGTPTAFALSGTSLTVGFTNTGGSPLRVQLTGDTAGATYWCYDISGKTSPQTIPLASFNSQCWTGGAGTPFTPGTSKVVAIQMLIPSNTTTASSFNACLNSVSSS